MGSQRPIPFLFSFSPSPGLMCILELKVYQIKSISGLACSNEGFPGIVLKELLIGIFEEFVNGSSRGA